MPRQRDQHDVGKHGLPREETACPACGRQYGHHKTKVCTHCEECSGCCACRAPRQLPAEEAIQIVAGIASGKK